MCKQPPVTRDKAISTAAVQGRKHTQTKKKKYSNAQKSETLPTHWTVAQKKPSITAKTHTTDAYSRSLILLKTLNP